MARSPIREFMPFEIDRWFGSLSVQSMRDFQRGWYVNLLLRAWQAEPPCCLPDDENELMLLAGATSDKMWKEHSAKVLSKFQATGNGYRVNSRQLELYNEKLKVHSSKKDNGEKGGRPRKSKEITEQKPNGSSSVKHSSYSYSKSSSSSKSDFCPADVKGYVLEHMDFSGVHMGWLVEDAVACAMRKQNCDAMKAAEFICEQWDRYQETEVEYRAGKKTFLETGMFNDPDSWPTKKVATSVPMGRAKW